MKLKILIITLALTLFSTNVYAISFVNQFGSITGVVTELIPAQSGGLGFFIEIENESGLSRFYISNDTFVLGAPPDVGDTVTAYHGMVALASFEGEVLEMTRTAPGQYNLLIEYTGEWMPSGETAFWVDFNRTFLRGRFQVGDTITAYHNPWGVPQIFDMWQYQAVLVVNGDYEVYLGTLYDGWVSNAIRGGTYEGIELIISEETQVIGNPTDHSHVALVFENDIIAKVIVFFEQVPIEPTVWASEQVSRAIYLDLVPPELQSSYTAPITRAEFASLAVNVYEALRGEISGRVSFTDTNIEVVEKAAYVGIVSGVGEGRFDPAATLTREQAAVMLSRLANALGRPFDRAVIGFADCAEISSWAISGVEGVVSAGIMSGVGENRFAPQYLYTREQAIVTIVRVLEIER